MPDTPKPAPLKNPVSNFVKGALKRGRSVKPGSPLSMAAQLAAGELLDRGVARLQTPMSRAVTRGIASLTGTTDKMKKLQPSAYDMAGPDLTPEIIKRLKPKPTPLPGADPATTPKPDTETEGEFEINRRGRKVRVKKNTASIDPKANPEPKPKTTQATDTLPQTKTPEVKQKEKELNKPNRPLKMPPMGGPNFYSKIETTKSSWRPVKPK